MVRWSIVWAVGFGQKETIPIGMILFYCGLDITHFFQHRGYVLGGHLTRTGMMEIKIFLLQYIDEHATGGIVKSVH